MHKMNVVAIRAALLLALATLVSGCYYYPAAIRDFQRVGGTTPWWCKGTPDLAQQQCQDFSLNLDFGVVIASAHPELSTFTLAGGAAIANRPANIGVAFTKVATPTTFDPNVPNVYLYDGNTPTSRLVGFAWEINSGAAPAGFVGDRDVWSQDGTTGNWWLTAWVVRGYENHPDVFAASHPCLTSTGTILTGTSDACFTASHTEPFEIVVSNDDGYAGPGLDALVEALYGLANVTVHVVAPGGNQTGAGGQTTAQGYVVSGVPALTISGKPATAVYTTDPAPQRNGFGSPADSVLYALGTMSLSLSPEIVISGMNEGQNMGSIVDLSGTVGAARRARLNGVPGIATSQGFGAPFDFPAGAGATLALLEEWRLGHTVNTINSVLNINIPTCASGYVVRGTVQTVVATNTTNYTLQDCTSTALASSVISDIDGFNKGFASVADVGSKKPPNWP